MSMSPQEKKLAPVAIALCIQNLEEKYVANLSFVLLFLYHAVAIVQCY